MPFCFAPWSNLDISPQGTISPCCKFRHGYYLDPALNINEQGILAYERSRTLATVREDFQNGRWPRGCERCKIEEENGVASKRQLDHDRWRDHYEKYNKDQHGYLTASVAFGNTCNLTCITCNPVSSSRWQREYHALHGKDIVPNHFYKQGFVAEFVDHAPSIIHLDIPGGEPLLSGVPQQQELLQQFIDQGRAHEICLHYTTNVTVWPDQTWWDLWGHFQEIDMQLSVDGVGAQFEYIRYPANWNQVVGNIQRYLSEQASRTNLRLSVSHTVSAYNIAYVPEFLSWCESMGLPRPWLGRVHDPEHLRPSVWPSAVKKYIVDKLQGGDQDAQIWANLINNTDDSNHFEQFRHRLAWHDQYRKTDFAKTFPEMAAFL